MTFIKEINILPQRSTNLVMNSNVQTYIEILYSSSSSDDSKDNFDSILSESFMIIGKTFVRINHLGIAAKDGYKVIVSPNEQYMIMNLTKKTTLNVKISSEEDIESHMVIYDPYKYENEEKIDVNPEEFISQNICPIPEGYEDILAKWYSIKFSYRDPDYNLIFIKPGLGISFQTHQMREEHWEIVQGKPIIVTGPKVSYDTPDGTKFVIPYGTTHTIINPSNSTWAVLKEKFAGKFDEKDITRGFNPNNYQS